MLSVNEDQLMGCLLCVNRHILAMLCLFVALHFRYAIHDLDMSFERHNTYQQQSLCLSIFTDADIPVHDSPAVDKSLHNTRKQPKLLSYE